MKGGAPRYNSFTFHWAFLHQVPSIAFTSKVTAITSPVYQYRPKRYFAERAALPEAMILLGDVRRLLGAHILDCDLDHINQAVYEILDFADRFIATWLEIPEMEMQLQNVFTASDVHVRAYYMVFLSRHVLNARGRLELPLLCEWNINYCAADMFGVQIQNVSENVSGSSFINFTVAWKDVPRYCSDLQFRQNGYIANATNSSVGPGEASFGSDVKVQNSYDQVQQVAGTLQPTMDAVDLDLPFVDMLDQGIV